MEKQLWIKAGVLSVSVLALIGVYQILGTLGIASSAQVAAVSAQTSPFCDEAVSMVANVRCYGAKGNGSTDDTNAIKSAVSSALSKQIPLLIPAGTYKVSSTITINYTPVATKGFELISQNAILDGKSISNSPVLQIQCSVQGCFYFHQTGPLTVYAKTSAFAVVIGKTDFADAHNSMKLDSLIVNNAGSGGGVQLNFVLASQIYVNSSTAGNSAGLELRQTQFTNISGAASGKAAAVRLSSAYNFANTFSSMDHEESPVCVDIGGSNPVWNTWVTPMFNCKIAIQTGAIGHDNVFINPLWGGLVTTRMNGSTGVIVLPAAQ